MIPQGLQYLIYSMIYSTRRDFISMGLGIAARYQRNRLLWDRHLTNTKEFIDRALDRNARSVAIVGCGRLLDFPLERLSQFERVSLIDADPLSLRDARKLVQESGSVVTTHCMDVTGALDEWTRCVRRAAGPKNLQSVVAAIGGLRQRQRAPVPTADVVVSLNVLGQLGVYWRDRVLAVAGKGLDFELTAAGAFEPQELDDAVERTCALLQESHVRHIVESASVQSIFVFDRLLHYYKHDHAMWETHEPLSIESVERIVSSPVAARDRWLWHIAPQGIEFPDYGVLHEIEALSFLK